MANAATPSSEDQRPDLILAAAQDYDWDDLRPFVASLHATDFAGEIRFFTSGLSPETRRRIEAAGVVVSRPVRLRTKVGGRKFEPLRTPKTRIAWHLQGLYWHLGRALAYFSHDPQAAIRRYAALVSNVEVARYFWYLEYLADFAGRYRNVMLTDVRDVVFLGNPFDFAIGDAACFFLEDESVTINQEIANTGWIAQAYGPRGVVELGHYPISCSGVTIGPASAVVDYLTVMVDQLVRLTRQDKGIDQGVHNYVLIKRLVRNARIISNGDGPVLTVGIMSEEDASRRFDSPASQVRVLHQYDRQPRLAAAVRERLGP
jgi:hypothetical protein